MPSRRPHGWGFSEDAEFSSVWFEGGTLCATYEVGCLVVVVRVPKFKLDRIVVDHGAPRLHWISVSGSAGDLSTTYFSVDRDYGDEHG